MNKFIAIFGLVVLLTSQAFSQNTYEDYEEEEPKKGFDRSKVFAGGNFGLSFSNIRSYVNVSPQLGYRFNNYVAAGAGVNFIYNSYKPFVNSSEKFNYGYAGLNVFGRFYPIPYLLIQAQPELNYSWGSISYSDNRASIKQPGMFVPSLLLGAGGAIPTGGRNGALIVMVQYDAVQDARSPYGRRAFFSIGYNF